MNPRFINRKDFVPSEPLAFGIDLGKEWVEGLAENARWMPGLRPATEYQKGTWQIGAKVLTR